MTEPVIDLDAGALDPNALRAARIAFVKWKAERKPGDEGGPLSAGIRAYLTALPARATLDAEALEKALADTPKNDRYPKIQAIRAYLAALPATGAGEWRPTVTWGGEVGALGEFARVGSHPVGYYFRAELEPPFRSHNIKGEWGKHYTIEDARAAVALAAIKSLTQEG